MILGWIGSIGLGLLVLGVICAIIWFFVAFEDAGAYLAAFLVISFAIFLGIVMGNQLGWITVGWLR